MIDRIINLLLFFFYCVLAFLLGIFVTYSDHFADATDTFARFIYSALSQEAEMSITQDVTVWTDDASKAHDGLILLGVHFINNPAMILVDAEGNVLHQWNVEKKISNPDAVQWHKRYNQDVGEAVFGIDDAILFPDGSVIFSQSLMEVNNLRAQRIAKIDKDSNVLWEIPGLFHHDMMLAEDGNIYSVGSELRQSLPVVDQAAGDKVSFLTGVIQIVSPDGRLVNRIVLEEAFENSEFSHFLSAFDIDITPQEVALRDDITLYDPIHLNSVAYITAQQAAKLPFANEGDLLVSMRGNSTIAIVRPSRNTVVWARRGPWKHQHFVRMTNRATITIYDNDGGAYITEDAAKKGTVRRYPRVLEFDPLTGETTTLFSAASQRNMYSYWRGYYKLLENDTIVVSSADTGRVIQADRKGNIVWELRTVKDRNAEDVLYTKKIPSVKYYEKDTITFLDSSDGVSSH